MALSTPYTFHHKNSYPDLYHLQGSMKFATQIHLYLIGLLAVCSIRLSFSPLFLLCLLLNVSASLFSCILHYSLFSFLTAFVYIFLFISLMFSVSVLVVYMCFFHSVQHIFGLSG